MLTHCVSRDIFSAMFRLHASFKLNLVFFTFSFLFLTNVFTAEGGASKMSDSCLNLLKVLTVDLGGEGFNGLSIDSDFFPEIYRQLDVEPKELLGVYADGSIHLPDVDLDVPDWHDSLEVILRKLHDSPYAIVGKSDFGIPISEGEDRIDKAVEALEQRGESKDLNLLHLMISSPVPMKTQYETVFVDPRVLAQAYFQKLEDDSRAQHLGIDSDEESSASLESLLTDTESSVDAYLEDFDFEQVRDAIRGILRRIVEREMDFKSIQLENGSVLPIQIYSMSDELKEVLRSNEALRETILGWYDYSYLIQMGSMTGYSSMRRSRVYFGQRRKEILEALRGSSLRNDISSLCGFFE